MRTGFYREFAGDLLFTEEDVSGMIAAIAGRHRPHDPSDAAPGHVLFLGSRTSVDADVCMVWAPVGGIDAMIERVGLGATGSCDMLDYAPATFGEFRRLRTELKPQRSFGNWYYRTKETNEFINKLIPPDTEKNEGDVT